MFRVYDNYQKRWMKSGEIYMIDCGYLYTFKKKLFKKRIHIMSSNRYISHKCTELSDKNNTYIYEGDYLKAKVSDDETVVGMVTFAHELAAYIILCNENSKYYTLGSGVCEHVEIIGNVFDGIEE